MGDRSAGDAGRLGAYYGSIVDDAREPDDDVGAAFRAFVRAHEGEIRELVSTRRCQTNAVRRCSALYPGFAHVSRYVDGVELAVLEVGASAGLNLNWDRFAYAYQHESGEMRCAGATRSPAEIEPTVETDRMPPLPPDPPAVVDRVGIDVHPLDPTDETDARWLRSLVWPEHHDRRAVLDGALDVAADHPPAVVEGDAVTDLERVASRFPDDVPLVVVHTLVCYQLDEDAREAFAATLGDLAATRDAATFRLAGERPDPDVENGIQLRAQRVDATDSSDGEGSANRSVHLGTFEQHGAWLEWYDGNGRGDGTDAQRGPSVVHEDP